MMMVSNKIWRHVRLVDENFLFWWDFFPENIGLSTLLHDDFYLFLDPRYSELLACLQEVFCYPRRYDVLRRFYLSV